MTDIMPLRQREIVRLDPDRIDELVCQLGPTNAEDVMCRAMEELAVRLSHLDDLYRKGDMERMRKGARSMRAIAEQVGMIGLARVAGDVMACVDAADDAATAAVFARLLRVGESSLTAIWDLQDVTL